MSDGGLLMQRAVGLAVGICTVAAMTGVALAADRRPGATRPVPVGSVPGTTARPDSGASETIGTVEQVSGVLDYLGARRSLTFRHPGASYMKVHFSRLLLLPGDTVTVADPSGQESHTYAGDLVSAVTGAGRWAMSVSGDTAVVTLRGRSVDPAGIRSRVAGLGVGVDKVARGFSAVERKARRDAAATAAPRAPGEPAATDAAGPPGTGPPGTGPRAAGPRGSGPGAAGPRGSGPGAAGPRGSGPGATGPRGSVAPGGRSGREESVCGRDDKRDAVCYRTEDPVAYARSKAVARLLIDGVELCTGWRVGPNNRMFTNHHCFNDSWAARQTEVWFNYECAECGGWEVLRTTKVWGEQVLATDRTLDYTLFSVQNFPAVDRFGYLELDVRAPRAGEKLYIPQYPGGDPAKISGDRSVDGYGNCNVHDPNYWGYDYGTDLSYHCDTEGGSSGSPVLSRHSDRVIGLHHFGGCPNSGVRIDLIHDEVAAML